MCLHFRARPCKVVGPANLVLILCALQHEFAKRKQAIDSQFRGRVAGVGVEARAGLASGGDAVVAALQRPHDAGHLDNENIGSSLFPS